MEWAAGNIFIRLNVLAKAGDVVDGHKHHFDHTTFVISGAVLVEAKQPDGTIQKATFRAEGVVMEVRGVREGGDWFVVRADVEHKITALLDNTKFRCVYAHRTPQGDVVQEVNGWYDAYT